MPRNDVHLDAQTQETHGDDYVYPSLLFSRLCHNNNNNNNNNKRERRPRQIKTKVTKIRGHLGDLGDLTPQGRVHANDMQINMETQAQDSARTTN